MMNTREISSLMKELAPVIRGFVATTMVPLQDRLSAAEVREQSLLAKIAALELRPVITPSFVRVIVLEEVSDTKANVVTLSERMTAADERFASSQTVMLKVLERVDEARADITSITPTVEKTAAEVVALARRVTASEQQGQGVADEIEKHMREMAPHIVAAAVAIKEVDVIKDRLVSGEGHDDELRERIVALEAREIPTAIKGEPGENATDGQVFDAVTRYLTLNPVPKAKDGENASNTQVRDAVAAYFDANPPRNGEDGKSVTEAQVFDAVSSYLKANPPANGKDATSEQIATAAADYIAAHPPRNGENGKDATDLQVFDAVTRYLALNPPLDGKDATYEQIEKAVADFATAHPPRDGQNATDAQVFEAVSSYLKTNPPAKGEPGANASTEQVQLVVAEYLAAHPIENGKDATESQVMDAVSRFLAENPPASGKDASTEQVQAAVAAYIEANPPRDGKNATDSQVFNAVSRYLKANPPAKGADGSSASTEQIVAAVAEYLTANPPAAGENGKDATEGQVAEAVSRYLAANPPAKGEPGDPGQDATDEQVAKAAAAYLGAHPPQDGKNVTDEQVASAVSLYMGANPPDLPEAPGPTDEMVAEAVAKYLAANPPRNGDPGQDATEEQVTKAVTKYLAANPPPKGDPGQPGKDADPIDEEAIAGQVFKYFTLHPVKDGSDATDEQITAAVTRYLKSNPPQKGEPGDPGKNAPPITDEAIADAVTKYLQLNPPRAGKDGDSVKGDSGDNGRGIADAFQDAEGQLVLTFTDGATKNVGRIRGDDGADADEEDLAEQIAAVNRNLKDVMERADKRFGEIETKLNAVGNVNLTMDTDELRKIMEEATPEIVDLAVKQVREEIKLPAPAAPPTFLIDQDGNLVMVANGETKTVGRVRGKDGSSAPFIAKAFVDGAGILVFEMSDGKEFRAGRVMGERGKDGFGFEHMEELTEDDGRTIIRRYKRGDEVKEFRLITGGILDRGVYKDGAAYQKGDAVSYGGSIWIAQRETTLPPETEDWRLSVKRGREGKAATDDQVAQAVRRYFEKHPPKPDKPKPAANGGGRL